MKKINKNNFKLKDFVNKERVIHCETEEEMKELKEILDLEDFTIFNFGLKCYGSKVCYCLKSLDTKEINVYYGKEEFCKENGYEVIKWEVVK